MRRREPSRFTLEALLGRTPHRGVLVLAAATWTAIGAALGVGALTTAAAASAARAVVTPPHRRHEPVRVLAGDPAARRISVRATAESRAPGRFGIIYAQGHAIVGGIVESTPRRIVREVLEWRGEPPFAARWVRFTSSPQLEMEDAELPVARRDIPGPLGPLPAACFEAPDGDGDWAIHIHGRGAVLTEPLRGVRLAHAAGWSSLLPSYRNDPEAPASPDRRYGLGTTESDDVEAAIDDAVRRGARRIILVGWSMGGAAVLDAYLRTAHRGRIAGLLLESPVTSWKDVLAAQGAEMGLWPWVAPLAWELLRSPLAPIVAGVRRPLALERIEVRTRAAELDVPILLLHSTGDRVVPERSSASLARMRPDLIEYERFDEALHTRLWNHDAERWERVVLAWFQARKSGARQDAGGGGDAAGGPDRPDARAGAPADRAPSG